uniref:Uncharacterized protein n=1 Tax=Anguilla anguilla TaxID=7936 RepID=A0A0E9PI36_ANGAN
MNKRFKNVKLTAYNKSYQNRQTKYLQTYSSCYLPKSKEKKGKEV